MTRRTFGADHVEEDDDDFGPSFVSFVRELLKGDGEGADAIIPE